MKEPQSSGIQTGNLWELYGDGWGLVRASNTQPVLVMRFEARSEERLREIRGEFEEWLREQGVAV